MKSFSGKYIFVLIAQLFLIIGCMSYDILIKADGSAHVSMILGESESEGNKNAEYIREWDSVSVFDFDSISVQEYHAAIEEYFNSPLITNLVIDTGDTDLLKIAYDISEVDSLGKYMSLMFPYSVEFKLTNNSLIIAGSDGEADAEDDIGGYANLLTFKMNLRFEKPFKSVKTENEYIKIIDDKTIKINTSIGEMDYYGKLNQVIVEFN